MALWLATQLSRVPSDVVMLILGVNSIIGDLVFEGAKGVCYKY